MASVNEKLASLIFRKPMTIHKPIDRCIMYKNIYLVSIKPLSKSSSLNLAVDLMDLPMDW